MAVNRGMWTASRAAPNKRRLLWDKQLHLSHTHHRAISAPRKSGFAAMAFFIFMETTYF